MLTPEEMQQYAYLLGKMEERVELNEFKRGMFLQQCPLAQEGGQEGVPEAVIAGYNKFVTMVDAIAVAREGLGEMQAALQACGEGNCPE